MSFQKDRFQQLAQQALSINDEFIQYWNRVDKADLQLELSEADIPLLKDLILKRIEVLNSFELLVGLSPEDAGEILMDRYLGAEVSPDGKFGGYEFELSTMLDDFVETLGEDALKSLMARPEIPLARMRDRRVKSSLIEALGLAGEAELDVWYRNIRKRVRVPGA